MILTAFNRCSLIERRHKFKTKRRKNNMPHSCSTMPAGRAILQDIDWTRCKGIGQWHDSNHMTCHNIICMTHSSFVNNDQYLYCVLVCDATESLCPQRSQPNQEQHYKEGQDGAGWAVGEGYGRRRSMREGRV